MFSLFTRLAITQYIERSSRLSLSQMVFWAGIGFICMTGSVSAQKLNDSGLTRCVTAEGLITGVCQGTGQDAEFGRDASHPSLKDGRAGFKFARICNSGTIAGQGECPAEPVLGPGPNDWGCTRDEITGLVWEIKTDDGLRDYASTYTRAQALAFRDQVNAQGLCGQRDWTLPSVFELQSLVSYGSGRMVPPLPAIDRNWFPNSAEGLAQTATRSARWGDIYAITAYNGAATADSVPQLLFVRLVRRAGRTFPDRFTVENDLVRDTATGLTWRHCSAGQEWQQTSCQGALLRLTWQEALEYARAEALKTAQPWRLPNIKELSTLINPRVKQSSPATFKPFLSGVQSEEDLACWTGTATMEVGDTTSDAACIVDFSSGAAGCAPSQRATFLVRLVKSND